MRVRGETRLRGGTFVPTYSRGLSESHPDRDHHLPQKSTPNHKMTEPTAARKLAETDQEALGSAPDLRDVVPIESAFNEAAKRINSIWISFVLFLTYVVISTGKITHKDLFLGTPVKLPVLSVDVPLRGYFIAIPVFILALHFYFTVQLSGLAEKVLEYDRVLGEIGMDKLGASRLSRRIDNSLFAKLLIGDHGPLGYLLRLSAIVSTMVAPPWLLLFVQLIYLPQQDYIVTNLHRSALFIDALLAVIIILPFTLERLDIFSFTSMCNK